MWAKKMVSVRECACFSWREWYMWEYAVLSVDGGIVSVREYEFMS